MTNSFGIPQLVEYLAQMGLRLASIDHEQEIIELAFHGNHGQWHMIVGMQQRGEVRKLMLIAPHVGVITKKRRLQCFEALMAVNYRIAMGKFGVDLDDGEVRLEEAIPLANDSITFEQFQLAIGAMIQTVSMYHSLLPRIVYGNLTVQEALDACEQEFLHDVEELEQSDISSEEPLELEEDYAESEAVPELNVSDVLAEITRMFEERKE